MVDNEGIRKQLDRILASPGFAGAERLKGLLRYVVERCLAGAKDEIKESIIAMDVFGRGLDYDSKVDSVVRVSAGKLRSRLQEYYSGAGAADPILIELQKGSYVPLISARDAVSTTVIPAEDRDDFAIAIIPFLTPDSDTSSEGVADGLTEELTHTLANQGRLRIAAGPSRMEFRNQSRDIRLIGSRLKVSRVIDGTVRREGSQVRVTIHLIDTASGFLLWSQTFEGRMKAVTALQKEITQVISQRLEARSPGDEATVTPAAEPMPQRTRRWWAPVRWTLLAASLIGVCAFAFLWETSPPKQPFRRIRITSEPGRETMPSLSPQGTQIAFSSDLAEPGNNDIYVRNIATGGTLRLTSDPAPDTHPAWSPDGREVAFIRNAGYGGTLMLVRATGGVERRLLNVNLAAISWTPDGEHLAVLHRDSHVDPPHLLLVSRATGAAKPLTPTGTTEYFAAFSPDGKKIATSRCTGLSACDIYVSELRSDHTPVEPMRRLTWHNQAVHGLAWTGDSSEIVYSAGFGNHYSLFRTVPGNPPRDPVRIAGLIESAHHPSIPVSGPASLNTVAVEGTMEDDNIWLVPFDKGVLASKPRQLTTANGGEWRPDISPDGQHMAFDSDQSGSHQIWISKVDGTEARRLTSIENATALFAKWSPDSSRLAFAVLRRTGGGEIRAIYTVRPDGSEVRQVTPDQFNATHPAWSTDGKWIYFSSRVSGQFQIWKIDTESAQPPVRITHSGGYYSRPSGGLLYYVTTGEGVWEVDTAGGRERKAVAKAHGEWWTPVSDGIIYLDRSEGGAALHAFRWNAGTGEIRDLGEFPHQKPGRIAVDARETGIYYSNTDRSVSDLILLENYR